MISFDEFVELANRIYPEIKKDFEEKARGLIFASKVSLPENLIISPDCVFDDEVPNVVVLGRFEARDYTGLAAPSYSIAIFYGSFARQFYYGNREDLKGKLKKTIIHEIIHYYETHLGTKELIKTDRKQKAQMLATECKLKTEKLRN